MLQRYKYSIPNLMPRFPIPSKVPQQVFNLATPGHLLSKLHWEKESFKKSLNSRDIGSHLESSYMAFNTAVTAWHICDWVWHSWSLKEQSTVMTELDSSKRIHFNDFRESLSIKYRVLAICRDIANGSKHMRLNKPDPAIRAVVKWPSSIAGMFTGSSSFKFLVMDNGKELEAEVVFDEAFFVWERLLSSWGFIEGKIIFSDE